MQRKGWAFWIAWLAIVIAVALYAYATWAAIGNLLLLPQFAASLGLGITPTGWSWLSIQVALPLVVAIVSVILGRKRRLPVRALLLIAGVTVVSVLSIDITHSIAQTSYFG